MKKLMMALLLVTILLVVHPAQVNALDEVEENNLELKVERIESDGNEKRVTNQKNNEELFNEQNIKKLAEAKKQEEEEVAATKQSLFTQEAVLLKAHDQKDLFQTETKQYYVGESQNRLRESAKDTEVSVSSWLVGLGIVVVGTTGVYFYMKKR